MATRAPSLSLLIHTQPDSDSWSHHMSLDQPATPQPDKGEFDYGTTVMKGMMEEFGGCEGEDAYGSAKASSANPYLVGSVASRDALGGLAPSKLSASNLTRRADEFGVPTVNSMSPAASSEISKTSDVEKVDRRSATHLIGKVLSLWCPIALSTASLLNLPSKGQAYLLLASFCVPAAIPLIQELATMRRKPTPPRSAQEEALDSNRPTSTTSSVVIVPSPYSLRHRGPHFRSHSCPLPSEPNGYSTWEGKERKSLSSTRSVPYLNQHWTAAKMSGDRAVAPRSSFIRGLNLVLNPRPRLEILPPQKRRDNEEEERWMLPASVEGLLEVPQQQATMDSERTCFVRSASALSTLQVGEASGDAAVERSTDVILDMDSPGSPRRHQADAHRENSEHHSLRSPTKQRAVEVSPVGTTSFTREEDSIMGSNSASRLFSEIMDLVRQPSKTSPKGYASIHEGTVIIHDESSAEFQTAASELVRKGSTSSTISLASISSRFRSPFGSPSAGKVKKVRSRTFASAFGIELNLLNRGKRGTPESSPSTTNSSGCIPNSLLDLSFSPSPASKCNPSLESGGKKRLHRRNQSRADSIIDMLDGEGDVEEVMDPDEIAHVDEGAEDRWYENDLASWHDPAQEDARQEGELDDLSEADLADITVNDVWQRSFPEEEEEFDGHRLSDDEIAEAMGFKPRLATAPFLDTVEEESEGGEADAPHHEEPNSRQSLMVEYEAKQRQVQEQLAAHETAFPHKTLSQIEEVTELATTSRSRCRTRSSEGSSSAVHLGLPVSLGCKPHTDEEERQLTFVTQRSKTRQRAAARRFFDASSLPEESPTIDPSPRSITLRLGQLGMDQSPWTHPPLKLELDAASAGEASVDTANSTVPNSISRTTRLRRTLTLRSKASSSPHKKISPHKVVKKRRKSRIKGVAVMIARHQFTVVDEDDSLIQRVDGPSVRAE